MSYGIDAHMPRLRSGAYSHGFWVSFRWIILSFDFIKSKSVAFLQFGKNPVKFVSYIGKSTPRFMMQPSYKLLVSLWGFRIGTTKKPLNMKMFWSVYENRTATKTVRKTSKLTRLDK